ncbi:MAG: hypothetical protein SGJ19_29635 [Planctomycetia bacterium]|nr:hypothetical protein [Planctomycetia bacterium]
MSVAKRIYEAIEKIHRQDFEGALIPTSIALDRTAQKFYRKDKSKKSDYKQFLTDNMALITRVSLGTSVLNLHVAFHHPDIELDANGMCRFEAIIYHAVRCGLVHAAELPDNLVFEPGKRLEHRKNLLILPAELISGLMMAVVCCPVNAKERVPDGACVVIGDVEHPVNRFWGNPQRLLELL